MCWRFIPFLALLFIPAIAVGEESLAGLDEHSLQERYGAPDRASQDGIQERWYYGKSVVFLQNGEVTAWTDAGDLSHRQALARLSPPKSSEDELTGWENDWTMERRITPAEVIDELIER